jgi:hypothetical protein
MNQVTHEQKDSVTKTFAIVGFVAAILFAVWLAVQIVSVIPSAFSSLASIADGVYNYNEKQTLTVATKNSVVNTGEAFTLSWTNLNRPGSYTFNYACTEGASVEVRSAQGNVIDLDCDTPFILGEKTTLDVLVSSEKQRFVDIPYTVTHTPKNSKMDVTQTHSQITIVNASIPTGTIAVEETKEEETVEGEVAGESTSSEEPEVAYVAPKPKVVEEVIYAIPTSDPNGKVDLEVTYIGVGTLVGKTFSRAATIATDEQGAFQFAVRNIGTKTAKSWSYDAQLPAGIEYTSGPQADLKPNEKAIITIGFEGLSQTGTEKFGATVTAKSDVNKNNNSFTWAVEVVE